MKNEEIDMKKMRWFRRFVAISALALGAGIAQAAGTVVKIQDYPGMVGAVTRVALEKGYCAKYGLECVLRIIPSAPLGVQTLLAGDIDIAAAAPEVVIQAAKKGADIKVIGGMLDANSLMLFAGPALFEAVDQGYPDMMKAFKGRKVGVVARGSAAEFQLKTLLADAGMKPGDVTVVAVGAPNTGYPALVSGQVDAMVNFAPIDGFCDVLKTCRIAVATFTGKGPDILTRMNGVGSLYVMNRRATVANQQLVESFGKAVRDAERFIADPANADEVFRITSKYFRLDMDRGDEIVKNTLARFTPHFRVDVSRDALKAASEYLEQTGQIDGPFDTDRLF